MLYFVRLYNHKFDIAFYVLKNKTQFINFVNFHFDTNCKDYDSASAYLLKLDDFCKVSESLSDLNKIVYEQVNRDKELFEQYKQEVVATLSAA